MRTYYIFKIKPYYANLTKNCPYNLYKAIEEVYYLDSNELNNKRNIFDLIKDKFNKDKLNDYIYESYKNKYNYTKHLNVHTLCDYYTSEKSRLIINNTYLLLRSSKQIPSFLNILKNDNLFICDFKNKDYFWLEEVI